MIRELNKEMNLNQIINENKVVVVVFHATWCSPCRMLAPIIEEVDNELENKPVIVRIDVDEHEQISRIYQIYSVPSTLIFVDGEIKETKVGYYQKDYLLNMLKKIK